MLAEIGPSVSLDAIVRFLVATPFFATLDPFERADVVRIMAVRRLQRGEPVFTEGERADAWFVIFEGAARRLEMGRGGRVETGRLRAGDCLGELAALDRQPHGETVVADGPLTLFRFDVARFDDLLSAGSLGAYKLTVEMGRLLARRCRARSALAPA